MRRSILGVAGINLGLLGLSGALIAAVLIVPTLRTARAGQTLVLTSSTISLERLQGARSSAEFSYQGVILDESGLPAVGPIALTFGFFGIDNTSSETIYFGGEAYPDIMPDAQGRFVVVVPYDSVELLETTHDHYLEVKNTDTSEVISTTPVLSVPLASYAQRADHSNAASVADFATEAGSALLADHATSADSAMNAQSAAFSTNAQHATTSTTASTALTAGMLTNDASINLTLLAPFAPYDSGWDSPKANRAGRMVHLSGLVRPIDNGASGQLITTLPVGMRPEGRILAVAYTSGYQAGTGPMARIDINPNGTVIYSAPAPLAGNWFSLTGISFPVGP